MKEEFSLQDKIRSFKCDEGAVIDPKNYKIRLKIRHSPKRKIVAKIGRRIDLLEELPPSIPTNATIMFVGFNPGVQSSLSQHHYAHKTNLFWKLFNALSILSSVLKVRDINITDHPFLYKEVYLQDKCEAKPIHDYLLADYGVGFTDLCLRCTKKAKELSIDEKISNVPRLWTEFWTSKAPFIIIVGKGIWEIMVRYVDPHYRLKSNFSWGLQNHSHIIKSIQKKCGYELAIYVLPNTSGLVALMKYSEKLALWEKLSSDIVRSKEN